MVRAEPGAVVQKVQVGDRVRIVADNGKEYVLAITEATPAHLRGEDPAGKAFKIPRSRIEEIRYQDFGGEEGRWMLLDPQNLANDLPVGVEATVLTDTGEKYSVKVARVTPEILYGRDAFLNERLEIPVDRIVEIRYHGVDGSGSGAAGAVVLGAVLVAVVVVLTLGRLENGNGAGNFFAAFFRCFFTFGQDCDGDDEGSGRGGSYAR